MKPMHFKLSKNYLNLTAKQIIKYRPSGQLSVPGSLCSKEVSSRSALSLALHQTCLCPSSSLTALQSSETIERNQHPHRFNCHSMLKIFYRLNTENRDVLLQVQHFFESNTKKYHVAVDICIRVDHWQLRKTSVHQVTQHQLHISTLCTLA